MSRMSYKISPHLAMRGIPKLDPMYTDNTQVTQKWNEKKHTFFWKKNLRALPPDLVPIVAGSSTS